MCLLSLLLLPMLGSPKYNAREAATAALLALGDQSAVAVCLGMGHPDPEIALRCQRLHHERLQQERLANLHWLEIRLACHGGPLPYLDALPKTYSGREAIISRHVQHGIIDDQPEPWSAWRRGTRNYLRELVGEGASRSEVESLLLLLMDRSLRYDVKTGYPD